MGTLKWASASQEVKHTAPVYFIAEKIHLMIIVSLAAAHVSSTHPICAQPLVRGHVVHILPPAFVQSLACFKLEMI